jgi:hypothetical protein
MEKRKNPAPADDWSFVCRKNAQHVQWPIPEPRLK